MEISCSECMGIGRSDTVETGCILLQIWRTLLGMVSLIQVIITNANKENGKPRTTSTLTDTETRNPGVWSKRQTGRVPVEPSKFVELELPNLKQHKTPTPCRSIHYPPLQSSSRLRNRDHIKNSFPRCMSTREWRTIYNPGWKTVRRSIHRAIRQQTLPLRFPSKVGGVGQDGKRVVYPFVPGDVTGFKLCK